MKKENYSMGLRTYFRGYDVEISATGKTMKQTYDLFNKSANMLLFLDTHSEKLQKKEHNPLVK